MFALLGLGPAEFLALGCICFVCPLIAGLIALVAINSSKRRKRSRDDEDTIE